MRPLLVIRAMVALLLFEAVAFVGVYLAQQTLNLKSAIEYTTLWQQERTEKEFWQAKVRCARKLNGCSLRAEELEMLRAYGPLKRGEM